MMNGVKFDGIHSYFDLNLILSGCSISPATPKTNYVDIPGGDDPLDLTEALGGVKFNGRKGQFIFSVLPTDNYEEKKSEVSNFLNGKKFRIILDKDPDWYYIGRCTVSDYKSDRMQRQIVVDLKLQTFKIAVEETSITTTLLGGNEIYIKGLPVVPYVSYDKEYNSTLTLFDANDNKVTEFDLIQGTHQYSSFVLNPGRNRVKVANISRYCTITFRERSL